MSRLIRIALYDAPAMRNEEASEIKDITWEGLCALLGKCETTPCGASCPGKDCPHKNGAGWSPLRFADGAPPVRAKVNVAAVTAAAFDVDNWTVTNWAVKLEDMERALKGEEWCMHSTHSSKPELPKFRLVMPLSRDVTQEEWARLWPIMVKKYKIPTEAGSLSSAARMFYLPSAGDPSRFIFGRQ